METRLRLGDLLIRSKMITALQLEEALKVKKVDQKIGDALLELGYITEQQLIEVLEFQLGIPHVNLYQYPIDKSLMDLVPMDVALRNVLIPIKKDGKVLTVAMNDPMDYYTIDDLRLSTGFKILQVIAARDEILACIHKNYQSEKLKNIIVKQTFENDDTSVITLVNQILTIGIHQHASDIHIDPHEAKLVVRYRVDGILKTDMTLQKDLQNSLLARIKIMANLNITESRLPQDGRAKVYLGDVPIDIRISILPTLYGEKVVFRILDLRSTISKLSHIGFNDKNYQKFISLIERPSGMILLTGPTGSGKTSTLYAALNHLRNETVNIITIEDPVEYLVEGINQVQVNSNIGLTFASGLRSILRQDPNIIMVGEIRDTETAEIAIRASLTGHLVLSTLHTNSAVATVPRLIDMGIEPFLVMASLSGIVAQRLVRKICSACKQEFQPTEVERNIYNRRGLKADSIFRGKGCAACSMTGYKGRVAIQEVLVIDEKIRAMMMNNQSISEIKNYAIRNGMSFLIDDGLLKVKQGLTSIEEVLRVSSED